VAGSLAWRDGDYRKAAEEFAKGAEAARAAGEWISAGRFLANLSGAQMMAGETRPAIRSLLEARRAAERTRDLQTLQAVEANLANLYIQTGDTEAAWAAAERGRRIVFAGQDPEQRVRTLRNFGRAMSRAKGVEAGTGPLREALAVAEAAGSYSLEADILEGWGYELLEEDGERGLALAEDVLARAWYKRKLSRDGRMAMTEGKLARLYRKKGNWVAARRWIDRTLAALGRGEKVPIQEWVIRAEEAHISAGEGRLEAGLAGYRQAMELVDAWRKRLPPQERLRLGAERRTVQELTEGYLQAAGRLYRERPSAALAAEMFGLIQNTRGWSLDGSGAASGRGEALYARARRLEGRLLGGDGAAGAELRGVRATILEQEAELAAGAAGGRRGTLDPPAADEAVLTYWLHEEGSWLWVWTAEGLQVTELAGRNVVLRKAEAFRKAVAENRPEASAIGSELRTVLLGRLESRCLRTRRWDIVADEGLFLVPFGALPGTSGAYLAEQVEIRLVPNALRQGVGTAGERRFLAVADPIFNRADERRARERSWMGAVFAGQGTVDLPRLPGTRREAEAAVAAWRDAGYETALQTGSESGEEAVLARLSQWRPGVVHIGTHTTSPAGEDGRPRLALSLRADGSPGLLTAEDIAALRMDAELVVLSACHSAGAEAEKGAGVLGLTRAWLTAGARQVVSTLWPVGDESTAFFSAFYGRLAKREAGSASGALREAQLACIRGGGAGAEPRNWAGYVLLARR
jgi:CHAT domain-containing protein